MSDKTDRGQEVRTDLKIGAAQNPVSDREKVRHKLMIGRKYLTNWRPLTLLETFYKLLSAILAKRLKPVLDKLLGHKQKAYIPGRFIAKCTRTIYDLFENAKDNNLPGMMLMIDFEKAFDSVNFDFIMTTLDIFNFGERFKECIKIL